MEQFLVQVDFLDVELEVFEDVEVDFQVVELEDFDDVELDDIVDFDVEDEHLLLQTGFIIVEVEEEMHLLPLEVLQTIDVVVEEVHLLEQEGFIVVEIVEEQLLQGGV